MDVFSDLLARFTNHFAYYSDACRAEIFKCREHSGPKARAHLERARVFYYRAERAYEAKLWVLSFCH